MFGAPFIAAMMPRTVRSRQPEQRALFRAWAAPWTRRRVLRGTDHFGEAHLRRVKAILPRLTRPTRLIWGEDDNIFPIDHAKRLAAQLPNARLATIPNCGHWSPLDAPEAVSLLLREHMRTDETRPG